MGSKIKRVIFFLVIILSVPIVSKILPNLSHQNFYEYYEDASNQKIFTVIEDSYDFENSPVIKNNQIYISFEFIQNYIDKYIYWDEMQNKLVITNKDEVIKIKPYNLNYLINNEPAKLKFPACKINSSIYIPDDFLKNMYNLDINYCKKYKLVTVDFKNKMHTDGKVKSKINVRYQPNKKSLIAEKLLENESIRIFNIDHEYTKIRDKNGLIGYVPTKKIIDKKITEPKKISVARINTQNSNTKIKMVWDHLTSKPANYYAMRKKIPDAVNVISPTWFHFDTEKLNGDIINFADIKYVDNAHKNNCQVWALISDNLNYKINHAIISDSIKRDHVINQLLNFICKYNLDGINIDFEAVSKDDARYYLQFLRELSPLMKKQNAVLSVDMFVPQAWSMYYNRKEVGKIVDYVCVMAYDEYNSNSEKSGPVASYQFAANGIKNTLKDVPQDKLILGIPFYVRVWREMDSGFTIQNLSMDDAFEVFNKHHAKFKWLDVEKYFYCEYKIVENGKTVTYKTWLENENSIKEKLKLVKKFKLAGFAAWRRGFEKKAVWDLID